MNYSVHDIQIKTDVEHVRLRPRRYLGDYARTTAAREIIDNATDEFVRGFGTEVAVTFHEDGSIEVRDDGRGLPVDFDPQAQLNGIEKCLATLKAGSNFDNAGVTAGTNGEGATTTNAISQRLDATVYRDGKTYHQSFRQGVAGVFSGDGFDPFAEFTAKPGQKLQGTPSVPGSPEKGTVIRFLFDETILPDDVLDIDELKQRLRYTARLNPGMKMLITHGDVTEVFTGPEYGVDQILLLAGKQAAMSCEGAGSFSVSMNKTGEKHDKKMQFSLAFAPDTSSQQLGFVNAVYTPDGGSHVTAALKALGQAACAKRVRTLKLQSGEAYPSAENFSATVSMAVNVSTPEPTFVGQDKRKLNARALGNALEKEVERLVTAWVVSPANADAVAKWAHLALEHARTTRKLQAVKESSKQATKKLASGTLALPDKYIPSLRTGFGSGAELHLCEGDSAAGSVLAARDSRFQACFPLRGKQINSFETPLGAAVEASRTHNPRKKGEPVTMRSNESFVAIERILNSGVREQCVPENCRFDRIIFSTDADPDGANISAQLLCMFYFNFKPLLDAGMVYVAVPPLFVITTTDSDARHYAIDEAQRDEIVTTLRAQGKSPVVKRCKGLGEMDADEFFDTVMNPRNRVLRRVVVDEDTYPALEMAFGPEAQKRRDFLTEMGELGVTAEIETN